VSVETLVQLAIAIVTAAGAAGGVIRWVMGRLDAQEAKREAAMAVERQERIADREAVFKAYREERDAREAFFRSLESGRQQDRHDSRDELSRVANELAAHKLSVSRDHPTYDRLSETMKPFTDTLEDVKQALDRVFEKLDGKADKTRAGH
jgi:hypothetical protein